MATGNYGAGPLDKRVWLQLRTETRDVATNAQIFSWADQVQVWARVLESATDAGAGMQVEGSFEAYARPTRVFIRHRSLDKATMRLRLGSRVLRIIGTAEIGRRWRLELACEEWAHHV